MKKLSTLACVTVTVYGRVQGVFFRAFTARIARSLGLKGFARNLPRNDAVEICVEGEKDKLEDLIKQVQVGPPEALIERSEIIWSQFQGIYADFDVRY